jgi:GTPase SAR1 family protein
VVKVKNLLIKGNERKKWDKCNFYFLNLGAEDLNVVLFVVALSEYDMCCYEDEKSNRLKESIDQFDENINKTIFRNLPVLLVLNKYDLFVKKLKKKPLSTLFEDYDGEDDPEKAISFIEKKFRLKNSYNDQRIKTIVMSATNREDITTLFEKVCKDL